MILFYILILSFPLMQHPLFGREIAGFTVEKYLGVFCIAYALFYVSRSKRPITIFHSGPVLAFLLYYLWAIASYYGVSGPNASHDLIRVYTGHLLFMFVTFFLVDSIERLRWSLISCVAAMGLASMYCLREWQKGAAVYGFGYRPGYVTGDPNYFTASAILCLQAAILFILYRRRKWELWFALASLAVTIPAIVVTASRGGFIGLMAMLVFLVVRSRRPWRNGIALALPLLAGLAIMAALTQSPIDRLLHPDKSDVTSADIRLELWNAGLGMVRQHPVLGIGLGNFKPSVSSFFPFNDDMDHIAHNTYMENAAEMGMPGLLMFLVILGSTFVTLERTRRRARALHADFIGQAAGTLQAGLFGFAFSIFFLSAEFLKLLWFSVFLSAALPQVLSASFASRPAKTGLTGVTPPSPAAGPVLTRATPEQMNADTMPVGNRVPGALDFGASAQESANLTPSHASSPRPHAEDSGAMPEDGALYDPANLTSPLHSILTAPAKRKL
jgi:O-antigen ligase